MGEETVKCRKCRIGQFFSIADKTDLRILTQTMQNLISKIAQNAANSAMENKFKNAEYCISPNKRARHADIDPGEFRGS